MKRRSNWALAMILLGAAGTQAALSAFLASRTGGTPVARDFDSRDGVRCTACGPIPSAVCPIKPRQSEHEFSANFSLVH